MKHLEAEIEIRFVTLIKEKGGKAIKAERSVAGFPDRQVFLPGGRSFFVELKQPGQTPRKLQAYWHKWLRDMGQEVHVLDSMEAVEAFCCGL